MANPIRQFSDLRPAIGGINRALIIRKEQRFGASNDVPSAADYNGDGKADIAVFRPSTGIWYLLRTTSGFTELNFGISSNVPIPNSLIP